MQQKYFKDVIDCLSKGASLPRNHLLSKVSPFLDGDGIIRVGGRLKYSDLPYIVKHPIILPKNCMPVKLFIIELHKSLGHFGRETLITHIKTKFHIIGLNILVKQILKDCLICRKVHGKPSVQLMANLPSDRVQGDLPPFSRTGIDFFGPFYVSKGRGRAQEKRYGVVFTCLASRACHLEIAHSLDTDSFINSLRRFISRRGPVQMLRSDNGTNFTAGNKEIRAAIKSWNELYVNKFCNQHDIEWVFNPPYASHYGGVYEREIRSVRKVLTSLLYEFSNQIKMNDEMLQTLMCEIENILNSRPLNFVTADVDSMEVLTPNHILRLNSDICYPPGMFDVNDVYIKKRWRQVQYLADIFWQRWRSEYLSLLNQRQKWFMPKRAHKIGDIVLVVDQSLPRNLWSLGMIEDLILNNDGHVRYARVRISRCKDGNNLKLSSTIIERTINKLVLLVPNE